MAEFENIITGPGEKAKYIVSLAGSNHRMYNQEGLVHYLRIFEALGSQDNTANEPPWTDLSA
jgi:hypothetical protein